MSLRDEGYVKYVQHFTPVEAFQSEKTAALAQLRNDLYKRGLIGAYPDGIGFGNVSLRLQDERFLITGTQTGEVQQISAEQIAEVYQCSIETNTLWCRGPVKASSEALTHFAFYQLDSDIQCVIHIHHMEWWKKALNIFPSTAEGISYGTPQMAMEIQRLYHSGELQSSRTVIMTGHEEGIFFYGNTIGLALEALNAFEGKITEG